PLPWWLHRQLVDLAEQASDDSALQVVPDRPFYAEVLLGFLESVSTGTGRWLGVSMANRGTTRSGRSRAGYRVERVLTETPKSPAIAKRALTAAILVATVPLALAVASVRFVPRAVQSKQPASKKSPAQNQDKKTVQDDRGTAQADTTDGDQNEIRPRSLDSGVVNGVIGGVPGGVDGGVPGGIATGVPGGILNGVPGGIFGGSLDGLQSGIPGGVQLGVPGGIPGGIPGNRPGIIFGGVPGDLMNSLDLSELPDLPRTPPSPNAPLPPLVVLAPSGEMALPFTAPPFAALAGPGGQDSDNGSDGDQHPDSYVIMTGGMTIIISGSPRDLDHVKSLRKKIKGDFIWFRHDGRGYVITDHATVKAAADLFSADAIGIGKLGALSGLDLHLYRDLYAKKAAELQAEAQELANEAAERSDALNTESEREIAKLMKGQAKAEADNSKEQVKIVKEQAKELKDKIKSETDRDFEKLGKADKLEGKTFVELSPEEKAKLQESLAQLKALADKMKRDQAMPQNQIDELSAQALDLQRQISDREAAIARQQAELAKKLAERAKLYNEDAMKQAEQSVRESARQIQENARQDEEGRRRLRKNIDRLRPRKYITPKVRQMLEDALRNGLARPEP
ncbi:MAG TPA: hypothetical protein VI756_30310, partial [Blastocatellia bacterium]